MAEIELSKEDLGGRRRRYVARIGGIEGEAEIVFTKRGPDLISADHTGAPESMRGTGAAAALVSFMVEDARENKFRIVPVCPYVRAQYRKHPDWQDVMTLKPGEAPDGACLAGNDLGGAS
jgi:predicted GNAT family acetyltransferase